MNDFPLRAKDSKGVDHNLIADRLPDTCPLCHKGIESSAKLGFVHDNDYPTIRNVYAQVVFQCPRRDCQRFFIGSYVCSRQSLADRSEKFVLQRLAPRSFEERCFPDPVKNVSPDFCQIFNEAAQAETLGLLNVAVPGYRKAIEFLIKDLLIEEDPAKADEIQKTPLQSLIQTKIDDRNMRVCAERATWLGDRKSVV